MGRFYPLYVRRSDGKREIPIKKRKEPNQPTDEQLDQKPDRNGISDFYREVALEEQKHVDWRRKLGGMLARELDWKDKSGNDNGYILASFPENYRLYEHVKKTMRDGKTEVKSKTHAAGGNDRQDAYLYGHPDGRKKRFRSPNDFFPHLLWLCTDESGDPDNCTCKICSPEDIENVLPGAKPKLAERPVKQEPQPRQQATQSVKQEYGAQVVIPRHPSGPPPKKTAGLLPPPRNEDQKLDLTYNTFMYRSGELVWFKRGAAWGLSCIVRRWVQQAASNPAGPFYYLVQPLTFPGGNQAQVIKASNSDMRPWLAWSVPRYTNDGLNNLPNALTFDNADWAGMMQHRYGKGDMDVDGSILAAKTVDATYTPFAPIHTAEPEPGVRLSQYNGLFLGAEKLWLGDPVRLHINSGNNDVMILHSITERSSPNQQAPSISLVGDIYTLTTISHPNTSLPVPTSSQLPPRMNQDLNFRNTRSIPTKGTAHQYVLTTPQAILTLADIKGRWYEASLLLPILQPELFTDASRRGEIQESSLWMNARGDCVNSNRPQNLPPLAKRDVRVGTRREAFGRSVPPSVEIRDGVNPPGSDSTSLAASTEAMEIDPRFETAGEGHSGQEPDTASAGIDEFMNLDGWNGA